MGQALQARMDALAHTLPRAEPTLLQRALEARRAALAFTAINDAEGMVDVAEWRGAEADQVVASCAFFAALEAETGITRDLFRTLGSIA